MTPPRFDVACRVGSGSTILGGIVVGARALVGAGSVVTRDVPADVVAQWTRLSNLPNLIYTDGVSWSRYETGVRKGEIITLDGTLTEGLGELRVTAPESEQMLVTFLGWAPTPIRNVGALVRAVAPACQLLRDEVADQLARERAWVRAGADADKQLFSGLAADWRRLLFRTAEDSEFADGYAQTVTFGLLYARSRGIAFEGRARRFRMARRPGRLGRPVHPGRRGKLG